MSFSGFLKSVQKEAELVGKEISRGVDDLSRTVNKNVAENWSSVLLDRFRSGNIIQLVSRSSGRAVQIVASPTGQLVVDGCGPDEPTASHTHWTVINHGKNTISLQNATNYLAIVDGMIQVVTSANPAVPGIETYLRLSEKGQFMTFESVKEPGCHVGILNNGQRKSALATGKELDAHFGVRLIYSPFPPPSASGQAPPAYKPPKSGAQPPGGAYPAPPPGATYAAPPPPYKQ